MVDQILQNEPGRINEYATWLRTEIDVYQRYHNHKETMAWTATAFYLPSIVGLSYVASLLKPGCAAQVVFTVIFILLTIAVLGFVNMQYKMRFQAADIIDGLRTAMTRLLAGVPPLTWDDLGIDESQTDENGNIWPKFIQIEMQDKINKGTGLRKTKFLQSCGYFFIYKWDKIDNRIMTEIVSYFAIVLVSLIAIISIWL